MYTKLGKMVLYCTDYTGLFLYHVYNTVMLHSHNEWNVFLEIVFVFGRKEF